MKPVENFSGQPRSDDDIHDAAATWLARRDAGFDAAQAAEFARWRDADPRHASALRRAEATQHLLARLPETPAAAAMLAEVDALCSARPAVVAVSTLWKFFGGLAAAACVALFFVVSKPSLESANATYTTVAGDHQSINLPDGSTLVLDASSEVEVAFARSERRVRLQRGEAHFHVAKDALHPFIVSAGAVIVRAVGTAFKVRRETAGVEVLVTEGKVKVSRIDVEGAANPAGSEPIFLAAGERAFVENTVATAIATNQAPGSAATVKARNVPRLVFNNTPLSEVVERFNRYSRVQMEIADPDLAQRSVGGNFDADNAESFINLLSVAGDVRVERISENRVLLHKIP